MFTAVALWGVSGSPNVAIILSLIAVVVGTVPMIVNVWRDPVREPFLPWLLGLAGGVFGVLAIPAWNIAAALSPIVFLFLQVIIVLLISRKLRSHESVA